MKKKWKRNCPKCGDEIFYTRIYERDRTEKRNTNCNSCAKKGKNNPMYGKPSWNRGLTKETDIGVKKISESMLGDKNPMRRPEVRKKISELRKDKTYEELYGKEKAKEIRKKIKNKRKNQVIKHSNKTKYIMRMSAIKRKQIIPNHNPIGCEIIRWFNMYYGFNFQHAENGGEVCIGGYFPDGIDEKKKTIIEIDEKYHFNSDGTYKEKDIR